MSCSVLQYVAVCGSVLQCVAVCCSVLQYAAACCSVPYQDHMNWYSTLIQNHLFYGVAGVLQGVAGVLQVCDRCVAAVLQCALARSYESALDPDTFFFFVVVCCRCVAGVLQCVAVCLTSCRLNRIREHLLQCVAGALQVCCRCVAGVLQVSYR